MAEVSDVVQRSMSINEKLHPRLKTAAEQNAILRIGWTNAGDPVPKNGELGLCPGLPEGARIRALGKLGSWVAAFGRGGSFTIQGDAEHYLGAINNGCTITCEQFAGNFAGYMMSEGTIRILEGVGNDAGSCMNGGILFIRGSAGSRLGSGMSEGLIIVHGDVGEEPGIGMTGGQIIINGRCPQPPEGVRLRPLSQKEVNAINKKVDDEDMRIPMDAVCLECDEFLAQPIEHTYASSGDLSSIGVVSEQQHQLTKQASVDTVALIGESDGTNTVALPLPILPVVQSGSSLQPNEELPPAISELLNSQPVIAYDEPRTIDFQYVGASTFHTISSSLSDSAGVVIDFDSMPHLNAEELDGLIVALKGISKPNIIIGSLQSISRVEHQHQRATHHNIDLSISRLEDGSGIPHIAALPLIGRSAKSHLSNNHHASGAFSELALNGHDILILLASGINVAASMCPVEEPDEIAEWLYSIQQELTHHMRRIGVITIDSLSRSHLRALDYDTAAISGLRLTGYERPLPHWFSR